MDSQSHHKANLGALREALERGTQTPISQMLAALHPAEIAHLLESLPPPEREIVWNVVEDEVEGDVLIELNDEVRARLVEGMDAAEVVAVTEGMELDDLADFVADLPEAITQQIVVSLNQQDRERLKTVLAFDEDTAGGLMNPDTISVRPDITLEVVLRYLRLLGKLPDGSDSIFVVDNHNGFLGVLYIARLVTEEPQQRVADVMDDKFEPFPADMEAAVVAMEFKNRDLVTAPVVDTENRLLGQIAVDDVLDFIQDQAEHDILSMAGLDEDDDMFAPVISSAQRRAVWLGVNLATAFLAAAVVKIFEPTLDKVVVLAVLMPVVASMGGIAGSQTLTLMIRGLALGKVQDSNASWLLGKEIAVGVLNGICWALVVGLTTVAFFSTWKVGIIIASALIINLVVAALCGVLIPLILRRLRIDPALAGSVVLTTVTDVVGFVAFLGLGTLFLL